jgi:acylphosphatase
MSNTAKHIIFSGRVQGVGFRFTVHSIARRCQLTGMVRNLPDGSVEMIAQGHPDDISDCIRDLQETFGSNVRDVQTTDIACNPRYTEFRITF